VVLSLPVLTYLATPEELLGSEISVTGDPYRHLFRARRTEVGERLRAVDGRSSARWAEVVRVARTSALLRLEGPAPTHEPCFQLTLCVPTCRPERAAWLVEKATELGVVRIAFLHTARAPRELGVGTFERLRRLASAAVEQSHRTRVPEISGPHGWKDLSSLTLGAVCRWVLDTAPVDVESRSWGDLSGGSGVLLVGPEGGWTDEERAELRAEDFRAIQLGERVLRLETAAIAGTAIVLLEATRPR